MIQLDRSKLKRDAKNLNKIIQDINSATVIKNTILSELSSVIEPNVAKAIINGEKEILSLNNKEINSFLELLYKKTKNKRLNPLTYMHKDNDVKISRKEREMFNEEFKEKFLYNKGYSEETKRVARLLFLKTAKFERAKSQDIYELNRLSFEAVLKELKATTIRSLQSSISTIEQYINYAIKEGKINSTLGNMASLYSKKEDITHFLDREAEENMIFSKSEIDALSGYAENAQDGVILSLIFDGVSYKRKFVELRNIRIQDCDFNKMVINIPQLVDEVTGEILPERQVPISKHTRIMIKNAMDEKKYVSLKGETERKYKIAESDYILRGLRNNFQIKWENVNQRILRIAKLEGYGYLNATNIAYSGQIHYAIELKEEEGLSIDEACTMIIKRFNISENQSAFFYLKARIENAKKILE